MTNGDRISLSLLLLRLGVFTVMLAWTIDKFVRPEHASHVFESFYFLPAFGKAISISVGTAELALIFGFLCGVQKNLTYAAVLALHGISTLSSFRQYLAPFQGPNLLFFAAWPMLAACVALYLRNMDTKVSFEAKGSQ